MKCETCDLVLKGVKGTGVNDINQNIVTGASFKTFCTRRSSGEPLGSRLPLGFVPLELSQSYPMRKGSAINHQPEWERRQKKTVAGSATGMGTQLKILNLN